MTGLAIGRLARDRFVITAVVLAPAFWLCIVLLPWIPLPGRHFSLAQILVLGLMFPVLEELAFRGLIQGYCLRAAPLRHRQFGVTGANGVTSLLFAAAHLFHQPLWIAVSILIPSLIFGELRDRFGRVWPGMVLHSYYNLGFLLALMLKA
jgi:uncharacterized protein